MRGNPASREFGQVLNRNTVSDRLTKPLQLASCARGRGDERTDAGSSVRRVGAAPVSAGRVDTRTFVGVIDVANTTSRD